MKSVRVGLVILTLAVIASCGLPFMAGPDFISGKQRVASIAVVPAKCEITLAGLTGKNMDAEMSEQMERVAQQVVESKFKALGYNVKPLGVSGQDFAQDPELQGTYKSLLASYKTYQEKLFKEKIVNLKKNTANIPKWQKMGPYKIGDMCSDLCTMASSDALLFISGRGKVEGRGKAIVEGVAREMMGVGQKKNQNMGSLNITLVDGKTGVVLSEIFVLVQLPYKGTKDIVIEKRLARSLVVVFKKFPRAGTPVSSLMIFDVGI